MLGDDFNLDPNFLGPLPDSAINWTDIPTDPSLYDVPQYGSSGAGFDWSKLIPVIGQTFASTYNATQNPGYPSAYQQPQGQSSGVPADYNANQAAGTGAPGGSLSDFFNQYGLYIGVGVGALVLVMMFARSSD